MVVVALVVFPRSRVEQEVARRELEDEAGEGPHVGRRGVLGAEEDLGFFRFLFFSIRENVFFGFFLRVGFFCFCFLFRKGEKTICAIPASSAKPRHCKNIDGRASQVKRGRWVSLLGTRFIVEKTKAVPLR